MLLTGSFQLCLDLAQAGVLALQIVRCALDIALHALALGLRLVALQQPQQLLLFVSSLLNSWYWRATAACASRRSI